jgi:hypothetical protein
LRRDVDIRLRGKRLLKRDIREAFFFTRKRKRRRW